MSECNRRSSGLIICSGAGMLVPIYVLLGDSLDVYGLVT